MDSELPSDSAKSDSNYSSSKPDCISKGHRLPEDEYHPTGPSFLVAPLFLTTAMTMIPDLSFWGWRY